MAKRRKRSAAPRPDPVEPGFVAPSLPVPRDIARPPYARRPGGNPGPPEASLVRTAAEIDAMRRAGQAAAEVLLIAGEQVAPGVTTDAIDRVAHAEIIARGGYPSPLGYRGFPKSVCTSVNEIICHGIPDSRPLAAGDIVNIDVTVYLDGVHGDTSAMFCVGEVDAASRRLVRATHRALQEAIAVVAPGVAVSAIGRAIEEVAGPARLGIVRDFVGHAVGTDFHGAMSIPHFFDAVNSLPLAEGMTFTIEPMLTLGDPAVDKYWDDGWTAPTADGSRSAQFEHTLVVTADGAEILTLDAAGHCAHESSAAPAAAASAAHS